jgi:hypothetical protein
MNECCDRNKETRNPHTILVRKPGSTSLFGDPGQERVGMVLKWSSVKYNAKRIYVNFREGGDELLSPLQKGVKRCYSVQARL